MSAISRAQAWRARGGHFAWSSTREDTSPVQIFHVEVGDPGAPPIVLVHGFPTSSIDWFEVADRLKARFRVCMLDFPGYGFSDKPRGWGYSLRRDAELLDYYLAKVVGADSVVMVAHDRLIPGANHYLQNDRPDALVQTLEHALDSSADVAPGAISEAADAPVLIGRSRPELPDAACLIAQRARL